VEAIRLTLEQTPPEVAADIFEQGIILTGGGVLLKNLDLRIKKETGLSVTLADEPLNSVVLGAGKVISDSHLLQRIAVD
jgi:rod shape-determining protein MreB